MQAVISMNVFDCPTSTGFSGATRAATDMNIRTFRQRTLRTGSTNTTGVTETKITKYSLIVKVQRQVS